VCWGGGTGKGKPNGLKERREFWESQSPSPSRSLALAHAALTLAVRRRTGNHLRCLPGLVRLHTSPRPSTRSPPLPSGSPRAIVEEEDSPDDDDDKKRGRERRRAKEVLFSRGLHATADARSLSPSDDACELAPRVDGTGAGRPVRSTFFSERVVSRTSSAGRATSRPPLTQGLTRRSCCARGALVSSRSLRRRTASASAATSTTARDDSPCLPLTLSLSFLSWWMAAGAGADANAFSRGAISSFQRVHRGPAVGGGEIPASSSTAGTPPTRTSARTRGPRRLRMRRNRLGCGISPSPSGENWMTSPLMKTFCLHLLQRS